MPKRTPLTPPNEIIVKAKQKFTVVDIFGDDDFSATIPRGHAKVTHFPPTPTHDSLPSSSIHKFTQMLPMMHDHGTDTHELAAIGNVLLGQQQGVLPDAAVADSVVNRPSKAKKPRKVWSSAEFEALANGLKKYKAPLWTVIKKDPEFVEQLKNRSVIDLKDKARNEHKARLRSNMALEEFACVSGRGGNGAHTYRDNNSPREVLNQ